MTNIKKSNNTDKKIIELIDNFNNTIQEQKDSKDNHRSIFIDFYLKHANYSRQ